ncbi:hydroxymethylpyrimidine/phosphomethylpyrimidine kinase [Virgibacillus pantothenticus]|uniref:Hydroxymethylpyrimidine/phosphomethylpyrimidine kinase n=1 Tax=Virgibacillus pantothenticus TaxID=1473 RepID=A0A0L0QK62_VIRPA|nr:MULTISPECIES: bifunctional hydroxymethylpyrimidine kinase/phosphomethylpyrimidine kinase [Virgibacillus]API92807.1 bifunctional hydroxymethylpyrimidine kinase/phosphomethylpyrimidine kinase [Virgibacillus sp. 6R]KNE18956.1 phosphomethylpyrimidine kinase [Virgibacillus pantothenticus]MBS7428316.1 bifunctional hydroxymethylpyrimidine kinase/phosphomethylpyrimidine kinase [Virgibacillus sp. 19R1-5]MBU8565251.1 bifunctional hydroxymethylpyrimidine kinase/phosphomethylpyrimidine kinase [Virgibaci
MKQIPCALTIAGTDPSGGAGIQADLKTFQELAVYGMSVITSVVAQNTTGVQNVHHIPIEMIKEQMQSVFSDMPVHSLKTGMIANESMMRVIVEQLSKTDAYYVMDPVMVATSGDPLIAEEARDFLKEQLLPLATVVTPNIPEAEFITGQKIHDINDLKAAASEIVEKHGARAALVKGGHLEGDAVDYLYDGNTIHTFHSKRFDTTSTHGTGCTYSAAITAYLSKGFPLYEAVNKAKQFVTAAIKHSFPLGAGNGPTNHWGIREERVEQ